MESLYTINEVAGKLRVPVEDVRELAKAGNFPIKLIRIPNKRRPKERIPREVFDRWYDDQPELGGDDKVTQAATDEPTRSIV